MGKQHEIGMSRGTNRPWYQDWVLIPLIATVFAVDQASKILVRYNLSLGQSFPTEGTFRITNTFNTGSAFGLFRDQTTPLILASFVGIAILLSLYRNHPFPNLPLRLSLGLQLGGALGNLVDRINLGYVTDFIALGFWPVFNLADASIVVGITMLAWLFIFSKPAPSSASAVESQEAPITVTDEGTSQWLEASVASSPSQDDVEASVGSAEESRGVTQELTIAEERGRLDLFLAGQLSDLTRSRIHRLIEEGYVRLNGDYTKPAQHIKAGDRIFITVPPPEPVHLVPQAIPLTVVYQDDELLVIDKPAGMTVHPGPGHPTGTLVNALLALDPGFQGIGGVLRPGIVHRLDKDTSGLIVVAKNDRTHQHLSRQLKARQVTKVYLALVKGVLEPAQGTITAPIRRDPRNRKRMAVVEDGREAETEYRVLKYFEDHALLEALPKTGRTHQIRVHFASQKHPLVGDALYGKKSPILRRHFLHAHRLGFKHPVTGEYREFTSPLPPDLQQVLEQLAGTTVPVI